MKSVESKLNKNLIVIIVKVKTNTLVNTSLG